MYTTHTNESSFAMDCDRACGLRVAEIAQSIKLHAWESGTVDERLGGKMRCLPFNSDYKVSASSNCVLIEVSLNDRIERLNNSDYEEATETP